MGTGTHVSFENDKVGSRTFRHCHNAEVCTSCSVSVFAVHLVHLMLGGINRTRKTVAIAVTNNLDAPGRHLIPERSRRFKVDRVPGKLDEGLPRFVSVSTRNVWAPIAIWVRRATPDTCFLCGDSRWIDVEMGGGSCPVARTWNGKLSESLNVGRDQHGLVSWQDRLTECNVAIGFVEASNIARPIYTVWLVREGLLNVPVVIAEESTVH